MSVTGTPSTIDRPDTDTASSGARLPVLGRSGDGQNTVERSTGSPTAWCPDLESWRTDRARIEDIAFTPMATDLRNRLITRTYGDLADAMAEILGCDNATWTAFGQWASNSVGGFLSLPVPGFARLIGRPLGDGNRDVFADIGRGHAIFLATVGRARLEGRDPVEAWRRCERMLRRKLVDPPGGPGGGSGREFWSGRSDPRRRPRGRAHNADLIRGFEAYHLATLADDEMTKARLILAGNCFLGWHEQQLLSLALSVGFRSSLRTLTTPWRSLGTRRSWRHYEVGPRRVRLENLWIRFASRFLLMVDMPFDKLRLGRRLPPGDRPVVALGPGSGDDVPCLCDDPDLDTDPGPGPDTDLHPNTDPDQPSRHPADRLDRGLGDRAGRSSGMRVDDATAEVLADLDVLLDVFDVDGRASRCWNDPKSRMGFIIALFAEHQRWDGWFDDHGKVVRPRLRSDLDRDAARQQDRLRPVDGPLWPAPRRSHLTEVDLDRLHSTPSQPPIDLGRPRPSLDLVHSDPDGSLTGVDADVDRRFAEATRLFLDPESCRLARGMFRNWPSLWLVAHVVGSVLDLLTRTSSARVLGRVTQRSHATCDLIDDMARFVADLFMSHDGWDQGRIEPGGTVHRSLIRARRALALCAHGLDQETRGAARRRGGGVGGGPTEVGIDQETLVGAVLSMALAPLPVLASLGVRLDPAARDRHVRFWLGIGHLLGAPLEALTVTDRDGPRSLTAAEAEALREVISARDTRRTLDGVRVAESTVLAVADGFLRTFVWLAPGLVSALGDRSAIRVLLVDLTRHRFGAARVAGAFRLALRFPPTRWAVRTMVDLLGRFWFDPVVGPRARSGDRADRPMRDPWPEGCFKVGARPRPWPPAKRLRELTVLRRPRRPRSGDRRTPRRRHRRGRRWGR